MDTPIDSTINRPPGAGGILYPADPSELTRSLSALFAGVKRRRFSTSPLALVAPHSSLSNSGSVAVTSFAQLLGHRFDTVVVIAPSHQGYFPGVSVFDGESYSTPLGSVEIDRDLAQEISAINKSVVSSSAGHYGGDYDHEFTIETALPFLQIALGKFSLVPIVTGDLEVGSARALGDCLYSCLKKRDSLVVVSTDLSHYHDSAESTLLDQATMQAALRVDPEKMINSFLARRAEACGMIGLIATLLYMQRVGVDEAEELAYQQSAVSEGEVIGHGSLIFTRTQHQAGYVRTQPRFEKITTGELSADDRRILKKVALKAVEVELQARETGVPSSDAAMIPETRAVNLNERRGVFVSIWRDKKLVGRAGFLRSSSPLIQAVAEAARSAFCDSRLIGPDVRLADFEKYSLTIQVLSLLEKVTDLKSLDLTDAGVLVKLQESSAYLLPDEFPSPLTEPDSVTHALQEVCLKAKLPQNTYRDKKAEIYSFQIEEF